MYRSFSSTELVSTTFWLFRSYIGYMSSLIPYYGFLENLSSQMTNIEPYYLLGLLLFLITCICLMCQFEGNMIAYSFFILIAMFSSKLDWILQVNVDKTIIYDFGKIIRPLIFVLNPILSLIIAKQKGKQYRIPLAVARTKELWCP